MKYTDKQISKLLDGIFNGSITEFDLPLDYYNAVADYLKAGLYKGFGMDMAQAIEVGGKDLALLEQLRENVYMFSAAKTYQEVKEISSLLVDGDGNVRTSQEFNKIGRETYDTWNNDYGKTEYNTAVGQGTMAVKWNEIESNKEVLPLLQYSAVIDANTSDICEPLDGMVAKVDDPVWDSIMPLNHFNCRCTVLQLDEGEPTENRADIVAEVEDKMQPLFVNNAGKTGEVFTKDHPYFDAPKDLGKVNFNLPIKDKDD